jgi:hypothetical protein
VVSSIDLYRSCTEPCGCVCRRMVYAPVSRDKSTDRTALGSLLVAFKVVIGLFALGSTDRVGAARLQPSFGRISAAAAVITSAAYRHTWALVGAAGSSSDVGPRNPGRPGTLHGTRFHWCSVLDRVRSEHRCKPASTDCTRENQRNRGLRLPHGSGAIVAGICRDVIRRAILTGAIASRMLPWWRGRSDVE